MEQVLSAYTDEHIRTYFNDVKTNGLTEHGFPRLTANIGILIAHGRRKDILSLFIGLSLIAYKISAFFRVRKDYASLFVSSRRKMY